jgi:hypothetical protein
MPIGNRAAAAADTQVAINLILKYPRPSTSNDFTDFLRDMPVKRDFE